jgi:hypothetical protein
VLAWQSLFVAILSHVLQIAQPGWTPRLDGHRVAIPVVVTFTAFEAPALLATGWTCHLL